VPANVVLTRIDNRNNAGNVCGIEVNGQVLVDKDVVDPNAVSITAIDEATPSITTDGGSWSGIDGTGDPDGETFMVWSNNITITNGSEAPGSPNVNGFDGILTVPNYMTCDDNDGLAVATYTFNPPIGNGTTDLIEIYWYSGGTHAKQGQVNGVDFAAPMQEWTNAGTSQLVSLGLTHNQGFGAVGIYAIRVNGVLLVDTGNPLVAARANNLFQTWAEWNNVAPSLSQNNPAHVALFNAINTSLTAYPTDKATFVDALRTKIQGLSLTTAELSVLCNVSHTLIKAYVVTVASYNSANKFYLDGTLQATLALKKGTTYIFDQDDETNTGHPLKLYTDAAKTTEYTSGVTFTGTPGSALARTIFLVPSNAPATLYYQCGSHALMGGLLNIS